MNVTGTENNFTSSDSLFKQDVQFELIERIADFLPVMIIVYDRLSQKVRLVNRHVRENLGYDPSRHDWQIKKWADDIRQLESASVRYDSRSGDKPFSVRLPIRDQYERLMICDVHAVRMLPAPEDDSELLLLIAGKPEADNKKMNYGISAHELEETLRFGTWTYFPESGEMQWSDGLCRLFGYDDQIKIKHDLNFFISHFRDADAEKWEQFMLGKGDHSSREHEFDLITAKGIRRISVMSRAVQAENSRVKYYSGILWDITRYYNLYNDLLSYKKMVVAKEYFLNNGSWEVDLISKEIIWSDGMYHIFGYDHADMDPQDLTHQLLYKHLSGDDEVERAREDWEQFLLNSDQYTREMQIITRDGKTKRVESCGRIIRDAGGRAVKVIGATRDVTQLKEYELKLEAKVQELAKINKELEEFAYVASHDLQEPLRKITTFSERLMAKFSDTLGTEGKMYLDRMAAAAGNMRMLIENLLDFSRTTRNINNFEKCSLEEIVRDVLKDLELKLEETSACIKVENLPVADAIPSLMKQLFANLISNAVKFRKPGQSPDITISARVTSDEEKAAFGLKPNAKYYSISVSDQGIGFEEEYKERIFKIFQRLHGKSEYPGSGIGLAICKKIIDFHNGIIYANSQPGKGSDFTFILPETQYKQTTV